MIRKFQYLSCFAVCGILNIATVLTFVPCAEGATIRTVILRDSGIEPSMIAATKDEPVSLRVINRGKKIHNFVIPDFYIFTQNLSPGQSTSVGFSPEKVGSFRYYSDAPGAEEPGLTGQLQVHE